MFALSPDMSNPDPGADLREAEIYMHTEYTLLSYTARPQTLSLSHFIRNTSTFMQLSNQVAAAQNTKSCKYVVRSCQDRVQHQNREKCDRCDVDRGMAGGARRVGLSI